MRYYDVILLLLILTNVATMAGWYICSDQRDRERAYIRKLTAEALKEHRQLEQQLHEAIRDVYAGGRK